MEFNVRVIYCQDNKQLQLTLLACTYKLNSKNGALAGRLALPRLAASARDHCAEAARVFLGEKRRRAACSHGWICQAGEQDYKRQLLCFYCRQRPGAARNLIGDENQSKVAPGLGPHMHHRFSARHLRTIKLLSIANPHVYTIYEYFSISDHWDEVDTSLYLRQHFRVRLMLVCTLAERDHTQGSRFVDAHCGLEMRLITAANACLAYSLEFCNFLFWGMGKMGDFIAEN